MEYLGAAILSWFLAQVIKVVRQAIKDKKITLYSLIASGGMPSSHTALVVALSTKVGVNTGIDSIYFAICTVFSFIIMYDAAGVRRSVGIQAQRLNKLMLNHENCEDPVIEKKGAFKSKFKNSDIQSNNIAEILGHTPLEVLGGLVLGLTVGFVV